MSEFPASMWAYRLTAPSRLDRVEVPSPDAAALDDGMVLLRVQAGGICGSDLAKFRGVKGVGVGPDGRFRPGPVGFPMHEVAGEVIASRDPAVAVRTRVVGWASRSDAIAQFVVTKGSEVCRYDDSWRPEFAVLVQSLACVLYPVLRLPVSGTRVAVLGLGPIGLLFAHTLKAHGAREVVGVDPIDRTAVAPRFGLDRTVQLTSGTWADSLADGDCPDLVVEAVGHQVSTLQHAVLGCAPGGQILYFGIPDDDIYPLDMERLMRKNLTLIGGVTRDRRRMLGLAVEYLRAHPELYDDLVTSELPVSSAQQALELASGAAPGRLKVVLSCA